MCDRNHSWKRLLAQRDLKWNLKWNHSVHSKANSNVIIALFSTFGGLILLFLIWLYYEHRKSANITENCRRLGKSLQAMVAGTQNPNRFIDRTKKFGS